MSRSTPSAGAQNDRPIKVAAGVALGLRRRIVRGEIREGEPLPSESELMAEFGVSRPSLREALRVLESEHLITMHRGSRGGARAARPDIAIAASLLGSVMQSRGVTLADVYDARVWIEPVAVRVLARQKSRGEVVKVLRELVADEANHLTDTTSYARATVLFHRQLVELAGNRTLALLWRLLERVLGGEVMDAVDELPPPERLAARMAACTHVLDLIEQGESHEAEEFWRTTLGSVRKYVLRRHGPKTVIDILR